MRHVIDLLAGGLLLYLTVTVSRLERDVRALKRRVGGPRARVGALSYTEPSTTVIPTAPR